jgi:peptidoglycan/xylan/chitin deacetylase (PgdA/CDA1 family)/2-polyprenyl-3-methyl-5-hydroxy-6-metoxy-1,4-benzoquinol methylase
MICPLAPAHLVALTAFQISAVLLFISPSCAGLPLLIFILLCLTTPFFPRLNFFLPIVSRGSKNSAAVALTFDDGPDPEVTPKVLDLLRWHGISATFFVTGVRAERYPELIESILVHGHSLGNHSYNHDPFLMLKGRTTLRREIAAAQEALRRFGIVPLAFRPPVGITNSKLWRVLLERGMFCVNFSCRAGDMGNRRISQLAGRLLSKVRPGDIILLHDVKPPNGCTSELLEEFSKLLGGLAAKGLEVVKLEQLIGKEIMQRGSNCGPNATELFYDGLAAGYDEEQFNSGVSMSRTMEQKLFSERVPTLFTGARRVLEIGAGTGIFTLEIARNCSEVLAVDISGNMLEHLKTKAEKEGVSNITAVKGNVEQMKLAGPFSVVCAFSALEYLTDLPGFLKRLADQVEPGGLLYFITARTSFFRLFTQIGNAMRQGIWLKSHSRCQIKKMLTDAGFEPVSVTSHLLKCVINGGMLLEVVARRKNPVALSLKGAA